MKTAYSEENLKEEKSAKKVKGSKTDKSKSKSQPSSSRSKQSVKGTKSANNIFDHENTETETVQVQCGTDVMPFLTTFVTSIQLQDPSEAGRTNKRGKRKGSKASKGNEIDVYDGEEEREDLQDLIEFPTNDLNPGEQRILEDTFRMVYNNWTMQMCDGFFRTVYTVTLTLVEKDEDEDEYSVTLENTYRGDGRDGIEFRVVNGKPPVEGGPWIRSPNSTTSSSNSSFSAPQRYYGSYDGGYSGATQDGLGAVQDGPTTFVQTVSGSDEVPIYYVSLAATCRNCDVTDEVNFPLLMHPDGDGYTSVSRFGMRTGEPGTTLAEEHFDDDTPEDPIEDEGVAQDNEQVEDDLGETEEDTCTCALPVEDGKETETYRQRRRRHRRRLDGHDDLYAPPPNGPSPEQYIAAMNAAIEDLHETEGKLLRVAGLVHLIEPDYFEGENPELEMPPPNPIPTISPASAPSANFTTESAFSTTQPTFSVESDDFNDGTISSANGTSIASPVPAPTPQPAPQTASPTAAAEQARELPPTPSSSSRLVSWREAVLSCLIGGIVVLGLPNAAI
ncbi:expressed unknown protein [Seminavis robusta]|uniref:Uncharacterized protein n=1 Tax=Seminavis robusta TaxID=568900 RepID=A0A9N8EPZ0_9STRA|nr:expressed unknown protein [Seminavis robusta]|eukprot:Sro1371_g267080.1 n/a (560) ;mRNA; r:10235-11914